MNEIVKAITPWIAVISAVVAGYITLRNQMRLKAFEILLDVHFVISLPLLEVSKRPETLYFQGL